MVCVSAYDSSVDAKLSLPSTSPGQGSFFKPHVDTPRSEKMFGSLVVVFPTPHEGGALLIRHQGQEWTFDSASTLSTAPPSSVGYIAFFSDVEHEVTPVVSGHRVTLTYNLYFDDDDGCGPAPAGDLTSEPTTFPAQVEPKEQRFRTALSALLENPDFLPDGGMLGFGLRHVYQVEGGGGLDHVKGSDAIENSEFLLGVSAGMLNFGLQYLYEVDGGGLDHVYGLLKGSDATVYRAVRALGFEAVLYLYYETRSHGCPFTEAGIIDRVMQNEGSSQVYNFIDELPNHGGFVIRLEGEHREPKVVEELHWVTPVTTFNRQSSAYVRYGNEASLGLTYGDVSLIVRIGKAGERLAYPAIAQLKAEWEEKRQRWYKRDQETKARLTSYLRER
jgi:2-oxoglutarate-Fe(II)-dependent oxygenase superfamily protein